MNDRSKYLGGSDAAAILGVSPWTSPLELYLEKIDAAIPSAEKADRDRIRQRMMDRGKREEPRIVDDLVSLHGVEVVKRSSQEKPNRYRDPEYPFLAAEVDFEWKVTRKAVDHFAAHSGFEIPEELIGTVQNGEVKTAHPFVAWKKFGDEGTDEIPVEYGAQAMHGQMVRGAALTLVAVGVYVDDPLIYWMPRDDAMILELRKKELEFWRRVQERDPPPPSNLPDVYRILGRATETRIEATPEVEAMIHSLRPLRERARIAEEGIEALQFEIATFALGAKQVEKPSKPGLHYVTSGGVPIHQLKLESQDRVDVEKLREKYPEVAADVARTVKFFKQQKPRKGTK